MRLVTGIILIALGVEALLLRPAPGGALLQALSIALGILLFGGLWTPITGALLAIDGAWNAFASGHPWLWILLAAMGAALALIGPGAWSLDARLFGWRRVEIPGREGQKRPP